MSDQKPQKDLSGVLSDPYSKDLPPHVMSTHQITSRTWMANMLLHAVTAEAQRRGVDVESLFLKGPNPYREGEDEHTPRHTVEVRINGVSVDVPTFFQVLERDHEYFIREAARDLFKERLEETFKPFEQVERMLEGVKRYVKDDIAVAFPDVPLTPWGFFKATLYDVAFTAGPLVLLMAVNNEVHVVMSLWQARGTAPGWLNAVTLLCLWLTPVLICVDRMSGYSLRLGVGFTVGRKAFLGALLLCSLGCAVRVFLHPNTPSLVDLLR